MSEQLDTLTLEVTTLTSIVTGELDRIDAALDLATTRVGDTRREFWVDQISGDDDAAGTAAAPLASLLEVRARSVPGGITLVNIVGDYEMRERMTIVPSTLHILGDGGEFSFAADSTNTPGQPAGFVIDRARNAMVAVLLVDLTVALPETASEGVFVNSALLYVGLRNVTITRPVASVRTLVTGTGAVGFTGSNLTYPAEMAGNWMQGVAAGEAPSPANRVFASFAATL